MRTPPRVDAEYQQQARGTGYAYNPADMELLTRVIASGIKTPRATLEQAVVEGPGDVLPRLAQEEMS